MKLSHNQLRILRFIAEKGGEVTFSEIVSKFETQYYTNAAHYVGQSLASMVKNGAVKRVRKGVYAVGTGNKPAQNTGNQQSSNAILIVHQPHLKHGFQESYPRLT